MASASSVQASASSVRASASSVRASASSIQASASSIRSSAQQPLATAVPVEMALMMEDNSEELPWISDEVAENEWKGYNYKEY
jgi:hypothetical protein